MNYSLFFANVVKLLQYFFQFVIMAKLESCGPIDTNIAQPFSISDTATVYNCLYDLNCLTDVFERLNAMKHECLHRSHKLSAYITNDWPTSRFCRNLMRFQYLRAVVRIKQFSSCDIENLNRKIFHRFFQINNKT